MKKPLLVGQAPSRTSDPAKPLTGGPLSRKIAGLCGITSAEYLRRFARLNLLERWPGKSGKGDRFPLAEARACAERLKSSRRWKGKRVILLGRGVADAFGFDEPPMRWAEHAGAVCAVLPHPSGVNRWWNDRANRRRAARFMRSLTREVLWRKQRKPRIK